MIRCFILPVLILIAIGAYSQSLSSADVKQVKDIAYAIPDDDTLQTLNLVLPEAGHDFPLLIWIGGGAWSYGNKNIEMDLARQFARKGVAVASVGTRLSPATWRDSSYNTGVKHPAHAQDVAAAVKWLYDHAGQYGFDRNNLFVGGYSSGGHLAALIGLDSSYLTKEGLSPRLLKGIIPISGTYDIANYHEVLLNSDRPELAELHVEAVFGSEEEDFIRASPVHYLTHLSIPMLLMSDNNMYNYAKRLEEKIRETEFREMQVVYAYNLAHGALWRDLSFADESIYRSLILDFIAKHVGQS